MRLKSAHVQNFRRFVDLTIDNLPPDAKLIVLLGPNGCGKSSLFDAFQRRLKVEQFYGLSVELQRYYRRATSDTVAENEQVQLHFHGGDPASQDDLKKSLYVRSAYRHDPSFQQTRIEQQPDVLDRHTVRRLIDTDRTVQNNYQRLVWRLLGKVATPGLTTDQIMLATIGDLQEAMKTVFGDIRLDALVAVQEQGTFTFTKGMSRNFLYENLSAGEKAAFDLLLDLVVNRTAFNNSLYCVDEPEAHLSTRLQGKLLKEMYRLVPDGSQLWLATHSIGMVRTAQEILAEHPGQVVFLDMGFGHDGQLRNYDQSQTVEPAVPDHDFWVRHYSVALDDMAGLLAPDRIVLCEGSVETDEPSLDESCYNRIFAREFPRTRFVSVGPVTKVEKRMSDLLPLLNRIVRELDIVRFRDRDGLTPEEIEDKRKQGIRVMSAHRNIESILLSDGVLSRLCQSLGKDGHFEAIRESRDQALTRAAGERADDDLKPAAQAVHQAARSKMRIARPAETARAFMRDLLAPLVTEGTPEYESLRDDIFK